MTIGTSYEPGHGVAIDQKLEHKLVLCSNVLRGRKFSSIATELVKPIQKTTPHTIPLSNLDHMIPYVYSSLTLYYNNEDYRSLSEIVEKLKESLSKVLVVFYPLAGRLIQASSVKRPEIHCNDAGAVFTEALIEAYLEELKIDGGYAPAPLLSGIAAANIGAGPVVFSPSVSGLPTLIIQVTQFLCGGLSVAINWLHKVADGVAGIQFVSAWAECCRENDLISARHLVFDRSMLKPRSPPQFDIDCGRTLQSIFLSGQEATAAGQLLQPSFCIQTFSSKVLEKLKREATRDNEGPFKFSTADCLSAHLWRCVTRARSLAPEQITHFFFPVEGRKKITPPLSEEYFGNVLFPQCASATVSDLLSKPLSFAAALIRNAIQSTTDEWYRTLIDGIELQPPASANNTDRVIARTDLSFSSWANFPLYEMDFGWQKPEFAVRNGDYSDKHLNGTWYLFPSSAGKHDKTVLISLEANILATLLEDPQLYVV
ncbi:hypothetical protein O6H91_01G019800 [Diphasiastrum complanatum]|uniref:Uncharacterized protein n=1 Tax=Diphasiastrum complanatum TaxID=34168 RepID=A0ACC2ENS2_DIPCM|nr:hypothetical protein O6H91_01G019800 [Diphasiastrum complanatum]